MSTERTLRALVLALLAIGFVLLVRGTSSHYDDEWRGTSHVDGRG